MVQLLCEFVDYVLAVGSSPTHSSTEAQRLHFQVRIADLLLDTYIKTQIIWEPALLYKNQHTNFTIFQQSVPIIVEHCLKLNKQ